MTSKTRAALTTENTANYPDNTWPEPSRLRSCAIRSRTASTRWRRCSTRTRYSAGLTAQPQRRRQPWNYGQPGLVGVDILPAGNAANLIFITGGTAQASTGFLNGMVITHFFGGSIATGGREAFGSFLNLTAPTNSANPNRNYVAIWAEWLPCSRGWRNKYRSGGTWRDIRASAHGVIAVGATNMLNVSSADQTTSRPARPASSTR